MKKEQRRINIQNLDLDDFNGNINEVIERLEGLRIDGYNEIIITIDHAIYDDSYVEINLVGYRQETDEELKLRQDNIAKTELRKHLEDERKKQEKKDLYLKLKEEFENGSEDKT